MKRILIGSLIAGFLMTSAPVWADSSHRGLPQGIQKQMDRGHWDHQGRNHERRDRHDHGHKYKHKHKHKHGGHYHSRRDRHDHDHRDRHYHAHYDYRRHDHYDHRGVEHKVASIVKNTRELIEMNRHR